MAGRRTEGYGRMLTRYGRFKRIMDVLAASLALLLLWPVMALVALAIRLTMGSPVLFRQVRPGYRGRPFAVLKFRTMRNTVDSSGVLLPAPQRITKLGIFLRTVSLDELPQLWNVLRGEMSFIGPRPLLSEYLPYYTERERLRHEVRPGITGLAQVSGRNRLPWDERLELDVSYVENLSFALDLKILLKTLQKVASRSDIIEVPQDHGGFIRARQRLESTSYEE